MARTTVTVNDDIVGIGDAENRKDSEKCAALSTNFQIRKHNLVCEITRCYSFVLSSSGLCSALAMQKLPNNHLSLRKQ